MLIIRIGEKENKRKTKGEEKRRKGEEKRRSKVFHNFVAFVFIATNQWCHSNCSDSK